MEALLKHLVDMTCQRDHALLDSSIVSALYQLVNARQVRLHELFNLREELFYRPRVWIKDGKVESDETPRGEHEGEAVNNHPALLNCIRQRMTVAEEATAGGGRVLWLPMWVHDKVNSCLEVIDPTPYSNSTLHTIEGVLGVYRNYQDILEYSERDSLTGLLNRKTFDEKFSRLLLSALPECSSGDPMDRRHAPSAAVAHWLAVVDIDHFKRVNDRFGHLYGDEVLILVANLLRSSFREQDRVFRFGGEEFVVLLRSVTLEDARRIFERFRTNVSQHVFPQVGKVTVSLGFASIAAESPVVILGHADQALYYAKASGRDRICYYDELVQSGELRSEVSNDTVEFF